MKKIAISNYEALLFFLIRACFLGICSNNLYNIARQNSYISTIIGIILGIIPLYIYYYIITKYPDKNIFEIIETTFGKTLGLIINVLLNIFVFFFAMVIFYNLINFIGSQYLYKTPDLAIAIMFGFCFFYLLRYGIKTISITSTILFYLFMFFFFLTVLGLIGQIDLSNLMPFNEIGFKDIINGSFNIIALNISPVFLLTLIPYNRIENHEKFIKSSLTFYLLGTLSIFIVVFFTMTIFSPNLAIIMQYPEFHLLKRLSLIGFIERIENILSIQWIFVMIVSISFSLVFIKEYILRLLKKIKVKNNMLIDLFIYIISIIVVQSLFKSSTIANDFYLKYFNLLTALFFLILPFIIFLITYTKKKLLTSR